MRIRAQAGHLLQLAPHLTLMDRDTSSRTPWVVRSEQATTWRVLEQHPRAMIAKPRKTGISTACALPEVVDLIAGDAAGHALLFVVAIDTDDKATRQAETARDFARQLGAGARYFEHGFKLLGSGSELICATAGGFMPGRGSTIHRLRCTELPYWRDPQGVYQSLRSACSTDAPIVIETTMDPDKQGFTPALWRGQRRDPYSGTVTPLAPEFYRHFFRVEDHAGYRADPASITDAEWDACRTLHGFTDRAAAAWWWAYALAELAAGDQTRLMHDYPQVAEHLFAGAANRVITVTPQIAPVVEQLEAFGPDGRAWAVDLYVRPEDTSGSVFFAVDTAWGKGKTRSTVLGVDPADARIVCSFSSAIVMYDDLARIASSVWNTYRQRMPVRTSIKDRCEVLIEINGSGNATAHEATKIGLPYVPVDQVKHRVTHGEDACIKAAKRLIETRRDGVSIVAGPPELAEECDSLTKESGSWTGNKDLIMSLGMALLRRVEAGIRDDRWKAKRNDPRRIVVEDRMREARRETRKRF